MSVTSIIVGGLGNQIFELFAGLCYAIDNNMHHKAYFAEKRRGSYFHVYKCERTYQKIGKEVGQYQDRNTWGKEDLCIVGWFQDLKFFHHRKDELTQRLGLDVMRNKILEEYKHIYQKYDICLHFRLGDYKNLEWDLSLDYYIEALDLVEDMLQYRNVLVFYEKEHKNEVNRRISIFKSKHKTFTFDKIDTSIPDYKQMFIMSGFRVNIISNGTFAWWGAYLNVSEVIYPKDWIPTFKPSIFLENWIGL